MAYVPISPTVTNPPPSPRTRELAGLLSKVLEEYTKAHPATTKAEVRGAIRLAQMSAGPDNSKIALGLSLSVGLGVLMLTLGLFYFGNAGGVDSEAALPLVIAVIVGLLVVVLAVVKAQR